MNVGKFTLLSAVGIAGWVALLCSIGYAVGRSWESVNRAFSDASYVIGAIVILMTAALVLRRIRAVRCVETPARAQRDPGMTDFTGSNQLTEAPDSGRLGAEAS
jgi:hypothetical protein